MTKDSLVIAARTILTMMLQALEGKAAGQRGVLRRLAEGVARDAETEHK